MNTAISLSLVCMLTSLSLTWASACYSWSKPEEDTICTLLATNHLNFCDGAGAADVNCQNISTAAGGSSPQCADAQVCSFTRGGAMTCVTSNAAKPGYSVSRNCEKGYGVACPDATADLSDPSRMVNITGREGCGSHEATSLGQQPLCDVTSEASMEYCESQTLRDDLVRTFHPEKRLGDLCGGVCMNIRNSTDPTNFVEVVRCVLTGSYYDEATGQRDVCRFHLYNQGSRIAAVAYWGIKNMLRLEDVV